MALTDISFSANVTDRVVRIQARCGPADSAILSLNMRNAPAKGLRSEAADSANDFLSEAHHWTEFIKLHSLLFWSLGGSRVRCEHLAHILLAGVSDQSHIA